MPEKTGTFTNFWTNGVVEGAEATGTKLVPISALELVQNGRLLGAWPSHSCNAIGPGCRFAAFEATEFATTAAFLRSSSWTA